MGGSGSVSHAARRPSSPTAVQSRLTPADKAPTATDEDEISRIQ